MDGISSAANFMAIIQLAQVIGSVLKDYYEGVRDARKEIQKLYHAIQSFKATLDIFEQLETKRNSTVLGPKLLKDSSGSLQQCFGELWELKEKLPKKGEAGTGHKLKWPFQKSEITKAVDSIERHKSTLILQIGLENL